MSEQQENGRLSWSCRAIFWSEHHAIFSAVCNNRHQWLSALCRNSVKMTSQQFQKNRQHDLLCRLLHLSLLEILLPFLAHLFGLWIILIDPKFIHSYQETKNILFVLLSFSISLNKSRQVSFWKWTSNLGAQRAETLDMCRS